MRAATFKGTSPFPSPVQVALAAVVGLVIGVFSGSFGVGGGLVSTPLLRILLGVDERIALGTPLPLVIPTALSGAYAYHRRGLIDYDTAFLAGAVGMLTAVAGALLTTHFSGRMLMYLTSGIILLSVVMFFKGSLRPYGVRDGAARFILPIAIGGVAGFLSGLLGLGGGFLLVPLFIALLGMSAHAAIATSLITIAIYAVTGSFVHYELGNINVPLMLVVGAGSVVGAQVGSRLTLRVSERALKIALCSFFVLCAGWLAWFEYVH